MSGKDQLFKTEPGETVCYVQLVTKLWMYNAIAENTKIILIMVTPVALLPPNRQNDHNNKTENCMKKDNSKNEKKRSWWERGRRWWVWGGRGPGSSLEAVDARITSGPSSWRRRKATFCTLQLRSPAALPRGDEGRQRSVQSSWASAVIKYVKLTQSCWIGFVLFAVMLFQ